MGDFSPLGKIISISELLKNKSVNDNEFRIACFLIDSYNNKTDQCNPSVLYMGKQMGKSESTIKRGLRGLRKKKIISNSRGNPMIGSNKYKIFSNKKGIGEFEVPTLVDNKERSNLNYREVNIVKYESSTMTRKTIKETMNRNHYLNADKNQKELNESSSGSITEEERVLAGKIFTSFISKLEK